MSTYSVNNKKHTMKKTVLVMLAACISVYSVTAQTIADGIKYLNYEKNKSALEAFRKLHDKSPKDGQTTYWLGQAMLANDDVKGAKDLYQKALQENGSDPWVVVGMGHIDILEGRDINEAKQKFEQAITASTKEGKKKAKIEDAGILNAIGRANSVSLQGNSKIGDPLYGIEKLKRAAELDLTNPDIFINMGVCYLKMGGEYGGEAVKSFQEAISRDPKNAKANYRIGRIYYSQQNKDLYDTWFGNAILADETFPPVYFTYYDYYSTKNVNVAKEYLDKFIMYADKDCATDYFYGDYLFRAGKYQESLQKANEMQSGACASYYGTPLLFAYNNDRLGDSLTAKGYLEKFFANAPESKIQPQHFEFAANLFAKFPGSEMQAMTYIEKAIEFDTLKANKINYMNKAADIFGKAKKYDLQLGWFKKVVEIQGQTTEYDYYRMSLAAYNAKLFEETMNIAKGYIEAHPDKPNGYIFNVRAAKMVDTANATGVYFNAVSLHNEFLMKDPEKNKQTLVNNFYIMLGYYNDALQDYAKALEVCDKILQLIPDEPQTVRIRGIIEKNMQKKGGTPPASKSSGTSPK